MAVPSKRRLGMAVFALLVTLFMFTLLADPAWAQTTLDVDKTDTADPRTVGQNITYLIDVTAGAADAADDVVLTDPLPANTTFVSAEVIAGDTGDACNSPATGASSGTITCDLNTIDANETETVRIRVRPTAAATVVAGGPGFVSNTATADGSNTDSASDSESTAVQPIAGLTITKDDDPDPADVGESLIYTIDVINNTGETLDLDLMDDLPNSVDFIAVEPTSPSSSFCEETSGVVTCEINNLANGDTFTAAIAVEPEQAGTIQNTPQLFCDSATDAGCPSANPDTFTPIAQTTESTVVEDNNVDGDDGDDDSDDNDDTDDNDDNDGDDDDDNDDNGDDDTDDNDDNDDVVEEVTVDETVDSATDDEGGVLAESGVDPDEQAPVSEPQGNVVDEIATEGPLPNTGGMSILAVVLPIAGFLVLCLSIIHRINRNR